MRSKNKMRSKHADEGRELSLIDDRYESNFGIINDLMSVSFDGHFSRVMICRRPMMVGCNDVWLRVRSVSCGPSEKSVRASPEKIANGWLAKPSG